MKTFLIILTIVIVGAVITNPKKEAHVTAAKDYIVEYMNEEKPEDEIELLGRTLVVGFADMFITQILEVENYFLFSTTIAKTGDESRVVGIGAFNHVYIFDILNKEKSENQAKDFASLFNDNKTALMMIGSIMIVSLIALMINELS
ncbi:MAG: hypothetical protein DRJ07_18310 [Bacteroidetes bacterium]|nr:MAG: hypothetical protein DRJ07_18310 [Bacteroidota bacterium]